MLKIQNFREQVIREFEELERQREDLRKDREVFENYRSEQMALISRLNRESQSRLEKFVIIQEVLDAYNIKPHQLKETLDSALKNANAPQPNGEQSLSQSFASQGHINLNTNNNMINLNFNLNVASPPTPIMAHTQVEAFNEVLSGQNTARKIEPQQTEQETIIKKNLKQFNIERVKMQQVFLSQKKAEELQLQQQETSRNVGVRGSMTAGQAPLGDKKQIG